MKLKLLIVALFCSVLGWGQTTIAIQDFETSPATPTWSYSGTGTLVSTAGKFNGARSLQIAASNTITFSNIDISTYTGVTLTASFAAVGGDSGEDLFMDISYDNGTTWVGLGSVKLIDGFSNVGYNISHASSAVDPVSVGSPYLTSIAGVNTQIAVRFRAVGLDAGEFYFIDDIKLEGTPASSNTITTDTGITGSPFCVSASTGASVSVPFTSVGTFNAGNVYTAQLSNAAGSFASPVSIGTVTSTANSGTIAATIPAGTAAGTGYRIRVVSNNPTVIGTDNTVNLTVQNSAAITAQPSTTVQNLCQGAAATALSVTATGTTLTYQWYSNTTATTSGGTPVGTSTASYTPVTTATGTLYYYCVVSAACGASVTSNVSGAVNVTAVPSAPSGTINISANPSCGAATLTYSAPSANIYWQITATGTSTANPTTSSFTSLATAGTYIRYVRELNGTCWSPATASASFTIVEPIVITVQPPNRSITDGSNTTFTVTATGSSPTYQWQVNTGSGFVDLTNGAPYSNVTTATMTITGATLAMNGYLYRCIVSGAAPCGSATSNEGSLTVLTAPCLSSSFTGWSYAYGNWTHSENGTWTAVSSLAGSGQIQMNDVGDYLELPPLNNPTIIEYDGALSSAPSGNNRIKVQYFDGSIWVDVQEHTSTSTTFSTFSATFPIAIQNSTNVRVRLYRSADDRTHYIDNLKVYCGSPANVEIAVLGNGNEIVDGDIIPSLIDDTDFGSTLVGVDVSQSFTITNVGPDFLSISGITITGVDAADFYVSIAPTSTVAAGGSTTFEITFNPSALGVSNAIVNIANNDSDENPYTFAITGVATTCTPLTTISSITPVSGPVGTTVTINGTGFTSATSVSFGIYNATFTILSNTQIQAIVPANATTGDIVIEDASCSEKFSAFTVIKDDNTTCAPSSVGINELFISQVTDASSGSLSYVEIFNATSTPINMSDYSIRFTNYNNTLNDGNPPTIVNLPLDSFVLNPGDSYTFATSVGSDCAVLGGNAEYAQQTEVHSGINNNDCVSLLKLGVEIDVWGACSDTNYFINNLGLGSAGYNFMRKETATPLPTTTFNASDWEIVDFDSCNDDYSQIDSYEGIRNPPLVTVPNYTFDCVVNSAVLTVTGTEAISGGLGLTYQWYVAAPGALGWTALVNGGIYSGVTSSSLTISSIVGLEGYQYYCQVMEDVATCFVASNATIIGVGGASTTWNGTTWSNGLPTISTFATINGNYDTTTHGDFECCSLLVNATFTLNIQADDYVLIQNDLTNNGTLNVFNNGSLVQVNDLGVNTGNISYQRIASVKLQDYVYWSSPVSGFDVNSISPLTPAYYHWEWNPTIVNPNGGEGNWVNASTAMLGGKGYIVRAPNGFSNTVNQNWTVTFNNGVPNNGVYTPTIARGTDLNAGTAGPNGVMRLATDDNWNLLGNPYPSSISITSFLTANPQLDGFIRLWTHGTLPSTAITDPFYDNFVSNYTAGDYIALNGSGATSGSGTLSVIGGGQSFFVLMNSGTATTSTALFNNAMRDKGYSNSQFYRSANNVSHNTVGGDVERHRIWLDLVTPSQTIRTLVAYVEGATQEKDRMFDAITDYKSAQNFYSLINENSMTIQGRALPFDAEDKVPLGFKTNVSGNYTLALAEVDGLFSNNQNIYLEDLELGIIHDLKSNPYAFTATAGINNSRFVLRYTNETLGNDDFENSSNVLVSISNTISIHALKDTIQSVHVHNVLGQDLLVQKGINASLFEISSLQKNTVPLIIQITLSNGVVITKKIIY